LIPDPAERIAVRARVSRRDLVLGAAILVLATPAFDTRRPRNETRPRGTAVALHPFRARREIAARREKGGLS
jgi:hypothetical protein